MTDKRTKSLTGTLPGLRTLQEAMSGILPGLALCVLTALMAKSLPSSAAERFLPEKEITITGKVTAPSCQAQLDTDTLRFGPAGNDDSEDGRVPDDRRQVMNLRLSECEFNGLGLKFRAEAKGDYPERGILRGTVDNVESQRLYFTLGPQGGTEQTDNPLQRLSTDSADLVKDNHGGQYFRLNEDEYWYDMEATLHGGEVMTIPLEVQVHRARVVRTAGDIKQHSGGRGDGALQAKFTLQLSYR